MLGLHHGQCLSRRPPRPCLPYPKVAHVAEKDHLQSPVFHQGCSPSGLLQQLVAQISLRQLALNCSEHSAFHLRGQLFPPCFTQAYLLSRRVYLRDLFEMGLNLDAGESRSGPTGLPSVAPPRTLLAREEGTRVCAGIREC